MCDECEILCNCEHMMNKHEYGEECKIKGCDCMEFVAKPEPKTYQIVIEGSDFEQVQKLFEEIQNEYSLYDNCVIQEVRKEDSIVGCCDSSQTDL